MNNIFEDTPKQQFILSAVPETNNPAWITFTDEVWIHMVGCTLYDYIDSHPLLIINKNIVNKNDFSFEMNFDNYKTAIFNGETLRARDMIAELMTDMSTSQIKLPNEFDANRILFVFVSVNSPNFINAIIENGNITINAKLDLDPNNVPGVVLK